MAVEIQKVIKNDQKVKYVNLTGLNHIQVHEILEKLTWSLRRKYARLYWDYGEIDRKYATSETKEKAIYPLVVQLRKYFDDNYGLSYAVDKILLMIENTEEVDIKFARE